MKLNIDYCKAILAVFICIVVLIMIMSTQGCYTSKTASKQVSKALAYYPAETGRQVRLIMPCNQLKSDTTIFTTDTTILMDCPDTIPSENYFAIHDTIRTKTVLTKTIKIPVTLPVKTITIVKTIEDMTKVIEIDKELSSTKMQRDKLQVSSAKWKKATLIESGILLLFLIIAGVRIYSSLTVSKLIK